ncbi:MAG TPA: (Fe-S)-binding protein [Dehalococcoidales bacterium]|nr:(Fe-S)-binding protein [Dehalococcoidales bacterium]
MPAHDRFKEIRRFQKDNDLCMKCGFCMSSCPVYKEELVESSVARGRNALVKGLLKGQSRFTPEMAERLDKCTLCRSCTANCPAGVDIPAVVTAARADQFRERGTKFPFNIMYRQVVPHRRLFGTLAKLTGTAQKVFTPRAHGTLRHLPLLLSGFGKGRHIPKIAPRFLRQILPVVNLPPAGIAVKIKAGYMTGCMTDFVFPELGKKIVDFLTRQGVEVIIPRQQGCCGAPVFMGAGDFETGRKMADTNAEAFKSLDYVIVDCATCGSAMQDYPKYLADNPDRLTAYTEIKKKIVHITAFLTDVLKLPETAYKVKEEFKGKTVTWHDPCHLNHHMGVKEQPRRILKALKDINYIEMKESDRCCGMAGAFSLHHYELSQKIAGRKVKTISETGADIVLTGCPGCQIQLMDSLAHSHSEIRVMHIMDILE